MTTCQQIAHYVENRLNAHQFARRRADIERRCKFLRKRNKAIAHLVWEARAQPVVIDQRVIGWRLPSGETVCVKQRHASESAALKVMADIQLCNLDQHRVPVRVYPCPHCRGYHLTSKERV
jgi:hypothetical protein